MECARHIVVLWTETNLLVPWNNPEEDIKRALLTPTSTLLVAEIESRIIGTVMAGYDGHRGWIYYLAVAPEYQGKGYGKQLVQAAEEWLKSQNAPKVHLLIRKDRGGYQNSDSMLRLKIIIKRKGFSHDKTSESFSKFQIKSSVGSATRRTNLS